MRRGANINKAEVDDVPAAIIECDDPVNDIKGGTPPHPPGHVQLRGQHPPEHGEVCRCAGNQPPGQAARGHQRGPRRSSYLTTLWQKLTQFIRCRENFYCNIAEVPGPGPPAGQRRQIQGGRRDPRKPPNREVDLESCNIPMGSYRLKVMPTSFLSQSPAARYEFQRDAQPRGHRRVGV